MKRKNLIFKIEIELKDKIKTYSKLKFYKKIKYDLFTWNGAYSEKNVFFNENKENELKIFYKKSNHLTKEKTSPFIIPMIYKYDFNENYFNQKFYYDKTENFYIIPFPDLKIGNDNLKIEKFPENYYYCCLLTTSNHFKGIFILEKETLNIQFIENNNKEKKCCNTLLKKNKKNKYLKINYNEINCIFERRYNDQPKSMEIFTFRNKSYYFIFDKLEDKNKIYQKLKNKNSLTIKNFEEKWNKNEISTLEYLMWVNIFGNRSLRDISQYPIFPWLITNYVTSFEFSEKEKINNQILETIKKGLIEKSKRDFNCPLGLMELNSKGLKRKIGYINQYINSIISVKEELKLDNNTINDFQELKDTEINEIINNYKNSNNNNNDNREYKGYNSKNYNEIISSIEEYNIQNKNSIDYSKYKLKIDVYEQLKNEKIELISYPYSFGSNYSNAAYISHFLVRIFPFSLTAIEIQGSEFDSPDRLFINLEKTFYSISSEKSDLRELIPEFFFFPEMFLNINNLNLGKLQNNNNKNRNSTVNILNKLYNDISVKNVFLPFWSKNNPYLFIVIYREILEEISNINLWIDLIFGFKSNGIEAQNILNLYPRYSYEKCLSYYLEKNKNKIKNEDLEGLIKLSSLGMIPKQIFKEKSLDKKKINSSEVLSKIKIDYFKYTNILVQNYDDSQFEFNAFYSEFLDKDLSTREILNLNNNTYLYTGFFNGKSYIFNSSQLMLLTLGENDYSNLIDNNQITAFTFYESEKNNKILIFGTEKGSIKVFEEIIKQESSTKYKFIKIIHSHNKRINYMNVNSNLNMLIDCSDDNYINLYSLPNFKIIRVIYNNNIEKVFLSSSPIPSFITYNNKILCCYSINGEKLSELFIQNDFEDPLIIKGKNFIDYLVYKNKKNYNITIIRKLPYLDEVKKNQ